jgi:octaprenyl-diphosphate synthase
MPLPLTSALGILDTAAFSRKADDRLRRRLEDAQALLAGDVTWLERELLASAGAGPMPGSGAARHLVSLGGKRVRPLTLLLSAACFGEVPPCARELAVVAELVHSATLLHDDVVDEGQARRGAPAARAIYGNAVSVLAGDLLLVNALERTQRHAPDMLGGLIETLRWLVEGEIVQLRGRTELDVTEETYEHILRSKTASLFAWSARTGACVAGATASEQQSLSSFGEQLGIAFQLVDDALDYSGASTGKTLLVDLAEGKLTLPLVLAVARKPELIEPLRRIHAGDQEPVEAVSREVLASGACEETRRRANHHTERAVAALRQIAPSPAAAVLEQAARELARRVA